MKKGKLIFTAMLTTVLCVTTTTFSWFERPNVEDGAYFKWYNTDTALQYDISTADRGNLSIITYEMAQNGLYNEEIFVTDFSVSSDENDALTSGVRNSYRTDVVNNGATPISASLFISSLTFGDGSLDTVALGVNSPLKTFKHYGAVSTQATSSTSTVGKYRIYFQPSSNVSSWNNNTAGFTLKYGTESTTSTNHSVAMTHISEYTTNKIYYADIPSNAMCCQICITGDNPTESQKTLVMDIEGDNPNYCPNIANTPCYLFVQKNGDKNFNCDTYSKENCAMIKRYNSSIRLSTEGTFSAGLTKSTDYIGKSISYSSSNTAIFTVDSNGLITPVSTGTAKLTTTVTGEYGDTYSVTSNVTVVGGYGNMVNYIPIATNFVVPAGETISIHWFIMNDSKDENSSLYYTIDDVYLTL